MNRQEIAQQIQYRIYNLLKDRLRSNPKKQFKTAISVRYLALLKKRFGVNGRFKSNRPLECYFDFPESRVIRGNLITYPRNIQVRVSNPKKDGEFISLPHLVIRFFTVSNYWSAKNPHTNPPALFRATKNKLKCKLFSFFISPLLLQEKTETFLLRLFFSLYIFLFLLYTYFLF